MSYGISAENAEISGSGRFNDLSVTSPRKITLNFRDKTGWTATFSSMWDLKSDLTLNFGCQGNCSGSCMSGCTGSCTANCQGSCTTNCRSSCSRSCSSSCSYSCSGCGGCDSR